MSVGIVAKIESKLLTDAGFTEIDFTGYSGTIHKNITRPNGNVTHETTIRLKIPHISAVITDFLEGLLFRKAQYRVTDGNGKVHLVGDSSYPARLNYRQGIDGNAGSWNGYTVTITHISPYSYPIS